MAHGRAGGETGMVVLAFLLAACGAPEEPPRGISRLDLGPVIVGEAVSQELSIRNPGQHEAEITSVRLEGDHADRFSVSPPDVSRLGPGAATTFSVSYAPLVEGEARARLVVALGGHENTVLLSGTGWRPVIQLDRTQIYFGDVNEDDPVLTWIKITSLADHPIEIDAPTVTGDYPELRVEPVFPLHLAPGGSRHVPVRFDPVGEGPREAVHTFRACRLCPGLALATGGRALANPPARVSPELLTFGLVTPGYTARASAHLENAGVRPLTITNWSLGSMAQDAPPPPFHLDPSPHVPVTLQPGGRFDVDVVFTPDAVSENYISRLVLETDHPRYPEVSLALVGSGGGPDPVVPPGVHLGLEAVGGAKIRAIPVDNVGNVALTILSAEVEGDAFAVVYQPEAPVPAHGRDRIDVRFAPTREGPAEGVLVLTTDDVDEPTLRIPLSGRAVAMPPCTLSVTPEGLDFGWVPRSWDRALELTLVNDGLTDCLVEGGEFRPDASWSIAADLSQGWVVPAGERWTGLVSFTPDVVGQHQAELVLQVFTTTGVPLRVPLLGEGYLLPGDVWPERVDFGGAPVGCGAARVVCSSGPLARATGLEWLDAGFSIEERDGASCTIVRASPDEAEAIGGMLRVWAADDADYLVDLRAMGQPTRRDYFIVPARPRRDVLLVVDGDSRPARTFPVARFLAEAQARDLDLHVGVVATASFETWLGDRVELPAGSLVPCHGTFYTHPGLPLPDQTLACMLGEAPGAAGPAFAESAMAFRAPNVRLGLGEGFLRADAPMSILFLGDVDASGEWLEMQVLGLERADGRRRALLGLWGVFDGESAPPVWTALASRTGGALTRLEADPGPDAFDGVIDAVLGEPWVFPLSVRANAAAQPALQVRVRGADGRYRATAAGRYDPVRGALVVDPLHPEAPAPGEELEVTYVPACDTGGVAVDAVVVEPARRLLVPGETLTLRATALGSDGEPLEGRAASWTSLDPAVASVDADGLVTAHQAGRAILRAEVEGVGTEIELDVELLRFDAISAAGRTACGLARSGRAYCWGVWPTAGTTVVRRHVPRALSESMTFEEVSTGPSHVCARTQSGELWCRGKGALGDGSSAGSDDLVRVRAPGSFRQVAAGNYFTCGLADDDAAWCWGANLLGTLGDGTHEDAVLPVAVAGGHAFTAVRASGTVESLTACGVTHEQEAWCWGEGRAGQLGDGIRHLSPVPVRAAPALALDGVDVASYAMELSWGPAEGHACGVGPDGSVWCWGTNADGQLGDGTIVDALAPVQVADTAVFTGVGVNGQTGCGFSCGVTQAGEIRCWGCNGGRLGDGTSGDRPLPAPVASDRSFVEVALGADFACGLDTLGRAVCWGSNVEGQLGQPASTGHSLLPVLVAGQ